MAGAGAKIRDKGGAGAENFGFATLKKVLCFPIPFLSSSSKMHKRCLPVLGSTSGPAVPAGSHLPPPSSTDLASTVLRCICARFQMYLTATICNI